MPDFRLSRRADADLVEIAYYTIEAFGVEQARRYRAGLKAALRSVARDPSLGRSADRFAPKLRRFEYQSHVIFYVPEKQGVLIVRVLHRSMDVQRHL